MLKSVNVAPFHITTDEFVVLTCISSPQICANAKFILDKQLVLKPGEILTLENGEFYMGTVKIDGRWVDARMVPVIKEK